MQMEALLCSLLYSRQKIVLKRGERFRWKNSEKESQQVKHLSKIYSFLDQMWDKEDT